MCYNTRMPRSSNNTSSTASFALTLVLLMASIIGLGAFLAWFLRRVTDLTVETIKTTSDLAVKANNQASLMASTTLERTIQAAAGAMPAGAVDVEAHYGAGEGIEQQWEQQMPWFLQGEGYDPTDDRLPDPQSTDNADRTVLIPVGTDLLEHVKAQPTPQGFSMPFPNLAGEDIDG